MIVNGKPIGYLYMYCLDHDQWSENRDIDNLLADFDLNQDTWHDFYHEVDIAAEFGDTLTKNSELSDLTSPEIAAQARFTLEAKKKRCDYQGCDSMLTLREGNGSFFWGCKKFPECWGRRSLTREERKLIET